MTAVQQECNRKWKQSNPDRLLEYGRTRRLRIKRLALNRLQQQGGTCAACGKSLSGVGPGVANGKFDHDHRIGSRGNVKAWRGVLCHQCNAITVGLFENLLAGSASWSRRLILTQIALYHPGVWGKAARYLLTWDARFIAARLPQEAAYAGV